MQTIWERKYELDSLAAVMKLAARYHNWTQDVSPFDDTWLSAMSLIIDTITVQQAGTDGTQQPRSSPACSVC